MTVQERNPEPSNPLGIDGIEFIEFATSQPQAFGAVLQTMGFMPVARHRSREVMLYRQGGDEPDRQRAPRRPARPRRADRHAGAVGVRAARARRRLRVAAYPRPRRLGDADARLGDGAQHPRRPRRRRQPHLLRRPVTATSRSTTSTSCRCPGSDRNPPAIAGLHYFGIVQTILDDRTADWVEFYRQLFGFSVLPGGQYFGILPKGTLLESPCHKFYLQLIEPPPGAEDIEWDERLLRIGLGAPDVLAATRALRDRGVVFVDRDPVQPTEKGALTQVYLGGVTFELVVSHLEP